MVKSAVDFLERLFDRVNSRVNTNLGLPYLHTCGMPKDEEDSFARAWIDIIESPKESEGRVR